MHLSRFFGLVLVLASATLARGEVQVAPETPRANQEVVLYIPSLNTCVAGVPQVEVSANRVTFVYQQAAVCIAVPTPATAVLKLPAGTYEVAERAENSGAGVSQAVHGYVTVLPAAAPVTRTKANLDGLWWVPTEPGWGVTVTEGESGQLFVTVYHYGNGSFSGGLLAGIWYVTSGGTWTAVNRFEGPVYTSTGPALAATFDPAVVRLRPQGTAALTANPDGTLRLAMRMLGTAGPKPYEWTLSRFLF